MRLHSFMIGVYPHPGSHSWGDVESRKQEHAKFKTLMDNGSVQLALAVEQGVNFVRVDPQITRNERDLTLDVNYVITRGPRVFVERIDIEGNTTTLDRVVRREFEQEDGIWPL